MSDQQIVTTGGQVNDPGTGRFVKPDDAVTELLGPDQDTAPATPEAATPTVADVGPTTPPPATPAALARVADQVPDGYPVMPWITIGASWATGAAGLITAAAGPMAAAGSVGVGLLAAGGLAAAAVGAHPAARKRVSSAWRKTSGGSRALLGPGGRSGSSGTSGGSTVKRSLLGSSGRKAGGGRVGGRARQAVRTGGTLAKDATAARKRHKAAYEKAGPLGAKLAKTAQKADRKINGVVAKEAAKQQKRGPGHGGLTTTKTSRTGSTARPTSPSKSTVRPSSAGGRGGRKGSSWFTGGGKSTGSGRRPTQGGGRGISGPSSRPPTKKSPIPTSTGPCGPKGKKKIAGFIGDAKDKIREERNKVKTEQAKTKGDPHERYKDIAGGFRARHGRLMLAQRVAARLPRWFPGRDRIRARIEGDILKNADAMRNLHALVYGEKPTDDRLWVINQNTPPPTNVPLSPYFELLPISDQQDVLTGTGGGTGITTTGGIMNNPFDLLPESEDLIVKVRKANLGSALYAYYGTRSLPAAVSAQREGHYILAKKCESELPTSQAVSAAVKAVGNAYNGIYDAASKVGATVETYHGPDIQRLEEARVNEVMWDQIRNGGAAGTSGASDAFTLVAESEDLRDKMAAAECDGMLTVIYALDNYAAAIKAQSEAFVEMANRAEKEMPFHPAVGQALRAVHTAYRAAIRAAEDLASLARAVHAEEIWKLENPRTNEGAWDVSSL